MRPSAWRSGAPSCCTRPARRPPQPLPRSHEPMSQAFPIVHQRVMQALFGLAAAFLLAGCATKDPSAPGAGSSNAAPIITDSDETNARKRARLRVELAIGYFEQGQTTVALDEIKQALANDPTFA